MLTPGKTKSILLHSRDRFNFCCRSYLITGSVCVTDERFNMASKWEMRVLFCTDFCSAESLTSLLMSAATADPSHLERKTTPHYKGYNFFHSLLITPMSLHIRSLTEWHFVQNMPNRARLGSYVNMTRRVLKLTAIIFWYIIWKESWNLWKDLLNGIVRIASVSFRVNEKELR